MTSPRLLPLIACVLAAGCAAPLVDDTIVKYMDTTFDEAEAARLVREDGTNTIRGNGFMRQRGGGLVTCGGFEAFLLPATAYARERFTAIYGTARDGFLPAGKRYSFVPDTPAYYTHRRATRCDSQGNFSFERVPNGDYFVLTYVRWTVGGAEQGGALMHRVTLTGGQSLQIVLSR